MFVRQVDRLIVGGRGLSPFNIEVGSMDYGFEMHGILGMDFLKPAGALLDLSAMQLTFVD